MTQEQEIRAKALEIATVSLGPQLIAFSDGKMNKILVARAQIIEHYIRNGPTAADIQE